MKIGAKTDKGKVREQNEDAYGYHDNLFVLADGMGGHCAGEVASAIAVQTILATDFTVNSPYETLKEAVYRANQAILNAVEQNPSQYGMGTTIAVLYFYENQAYFTHIGDSRIYRYSNGSLLQLTGDHSLVAELVKSGSLTEAEAKNHPQRNILTRALGADVMPELEITQVPALAGDKFLLCSDGMCGFLEEAQIVKEISADNEPQAIVDNLVALANDAGGTDNITAILIEI
jgi:serine/threonine protein phosphatase PrpC